MSGYNIVSLLIVVLLNITFAVCDDNNSSSFGNATLEKRKSDANIPEFPNWLKCNLTVSAELVAMRSTLCSDIQKGECVAHTEGEIDHTEIEFTTADKDFKSINETNFRVVQIHAKNESDIGPGPFDVPVENGMVNERNTTYTLLHFANFRNGSGSHPDIKVRFSLYERGNQTNMIFCGELKFDAEG